MNNNMLTLHIAFWLAVAIASVMVIEKQNPKMSKFKIIAFAIFWPPIFFVVGVVVFFATIIEHSRAIAGDAKK